MVSVYGSGCGIMQIRWTSTTPATDKMNLMLVVEVLVRLLLLLSQGVGGWWISDWFLVPVNLLRRFTATSRCRDSADALSWHCRATWMSSRRWCRHHWNICNSNKGRTNDATLEVVLLARLHLLRLLRSGRSIRNGVRLESVRRKWKWGRERGELEPESRNSKWNYKQLDFYSNEEQV